MARSSSSSRAAEPHCEYDAERVPNNAPDSLLHDVDAIAGEATAASDPLKP